MTVAITIRNVPDGVRNELASRAALRRQSLQEFLLTELVELAARPDLHAWRQLVRKEAMTGGSSVTGDEIVDLIRELRDERP